VLITISAFAVGGAFPPGGAVATAALALIIVIGAVQVYLAVRIEFDGRIFELAGAQPDGFAGFDAALRNLGLGREPNGDRSPEMRAAGLASLVRTSGALVAVQLALGIVVLVAP
jgi:hypothetical protein